MKKYAWIAVIACSLVAAGCPAVSGRPKAAVYPNTRTLEAPCGAVWPELVGTVGDAGFRLVAKDDDGYIARFLYMEPQLPEILGGTDPDNLALARDGSGQQSGKLRIQSAVLALSPQDGGCEVKMSVSYQGRSGMWGQNWTSLESSGLFEYRLLSAFQVTKPEGAAVRRAARGGSRRKPPKTEVSFAPLIIGGETARQ
ncbi:MAG: hypothetical protein ACM3S5_05410 [Rhodospirillales bacterium]